MKLTIIIRGCVCCSSSGELINALEEITIRNEQVPEEKKIQHVILETTGLADPTPIHELITLGANRKGNDSIVEHYYMNSIITLIDTKHFSQTLDSITSKEYKNELLAQVLTTDTIILNKIDLLAPEELAKLPELKAWVHLHNPNAKIIETSFSKIPADHNIFDTRQASISQKAIEEASKKHDPSVEQTMVLVPGFVDINKLQTFIKNTTRKGNVYRVKGVLALPSNPNIKFVIQGVNQDQLTITEHGPWQNDETKESRVTFIGKNVLKVCNELQDEFKTCLIK